MKLLKFPLTFMFAIAFFISSCRKDDFKPETNDIQTRPVIGQNEGLIVLGEKLEDPYKLSNVKKAYENLKSTNTEVPAIEIQATHLYLRFLPKDESEWGILKSDSTLILYDFPLDYEIANLGTYYHDPSLPDSAITWQYCVVPIGKSIPNIQHELLYEVCLTDDVSGLKRSSEMDQFLTELEYESVRLTGNLPESEKNLKELKSLLPSKWTPKGNIKVYDEIGFTTTTSSQVFDHWEYYDCSGGGGGAMPIIQQEQCQRAVYRTVYSTATSNYRPLVQASVHARWFTHIERCLTDANGNFQTSQFRYEVNYAIKWERADFDIRSGNWGQAWYNGPKQKGDWNLTIEKGGMSWIYAHIHRGAYTYYYANTFGIKTPPKDGKLFKQRIHIGAMDKSGRAHYYDFNKFWLCPQIKIYAYDDSGNWRSGEYIFGTAVHELAHASHWEIGYNYGQYIIDAIFSEPFLPESWAQGVETVITSKIYGNPWQQNQTSILSSILGNGGYTPIVWDMMDNINQNIKDTRCPIDNVSGYTLTQLENALYGHNTWGSWRDAIRDNYNNPTENKLSELFANYK